MNVSSDLGSSSEASSSESPSRKRPCSRTLDDSALESTESEPLSTGNEGTENPDALTNKKPRFLFLILF